MIKREIIVLSLKIKMKEEFNIVPTNVTSKI